MTDILVLFDTEVDEDTFETDRAVLFKNCAAIDEVEAKMNKLDMDTDELFESPAVLKIEGDVKSIEVLQSLADIEVETVK